MKCGLKQVWKRCVFILILVILCFASALNSNAIEITGIDPIEDVIYLDVTYQNTLGMTSPSGFIDITGIVPGDTFTRFTQINFNCKEPVSLQMDYFKPREDSKLLEAINLKVYDNDRLIYEGASDSVPENIAVTSPIQGMTTLRFEFDFPKERKNEYQATSGIMTLAFSVQVDENSSNETEDNSQIDGGGNSTNQHNKNEGGWLATGVGFNIVTLVVFIISLGYIVYNVVNMRKAKEK